MNADLLQGFTLGELRIEPLAGRVRGPGGDVHLPPHAAEVLLRLARDHGQVVAREELLADVWGEGKGKDESLNHAVGELRRALGDDAHEPRYIQTLPRTGYRLVVEPVPITDERVSSDAAAASAGLIENLQRRGVFETAIAYLVLGWLIIQVADVVFDQLLLPRWAGTFVTVLVIAGFPIALALSWFVEFRRGSAVLDDGSELSRRRRFGRSYVSIVASLGIAGLLVFAYDRYIGLPDETPPATSIDQEAPDILPVQANSVGVLPFFNIDGGERTQVFAHGLAEDVINRLAMIPGLAVASRGDCWSLEPNTPSQDVRRRLRVAYFLEGSVRLEGDRLRVVVQLIDSLTGFHLVSRSFDRELEDFMDVQKDVTDLVVANLRVALPAETRSMLAASYDETDVDAYVLYRKGKDILDQPRKPGSPDAAIDYFSQALGLDPDYAAAHAGTCSAQVIRFDLSNDPGDLAAAEQACATALNRNPNLHMVHTAIGHLHEISGRLGQAALSYEKAIAISPSDAEAITGLAWVLNRKQDFDAAEAQFRRAIDAQPGNWRSLNSLGAFHFGLGRYAEAAEAFGAIVFLDPGNFTARQNEGAALIMAGEFERGRAVLEQALVLEESATNYSNLGAIHYFLGEYLRSADLHRRAVDAAPGDSPRWVNLADTLYFAGRRDEASEAFARAAELAQTRLAVDAGDIDSLYSLAWARQMLGDGAAAAESIGRALELSPTNPYGHYYLGLILSRQGRHAEAVSAFRSALEAGYPPRLLLAEPYLRELRETPEFQSLFTNAR
ncbi:MAG: tetratricopeptide repeat protein [Gammaproteobacteria bacterium]|nr:tetratricopeptide repeat protein [Gammaproteobacteria bacterium]MDH4256790.1 tetratricopeptide repeat protein [Gammaproteobacteria bacterium]MDH5308512.1 tetratricopeptide repeat protein [Gammaproteobacteria bacterium]